MGGRIDIEADNVLEFSANFGSFDSLNVRTRWGASWWAARMRCTERKLTPAAFASIRPLQWVASAGGAESTKSTTRCTVAAGSGGLLGLRVLSRVSPSTPSAMNRACQRHTTGLALPDRRMISVVPQPSAVARTILARQTCFLRRVAIAGNRLKPTAISRRDVHDNSCSHGESLNCFGHFGNRPNESDH
jgi:hypothetical protein